MTEENIKKLQALRLLPRGLNVDSRIAAIKDLLGEQEVFKTIQNLRWPEGIVCPRCHSTNIVLKKPPKGSTDKRGHYECLQCQKAGGNSIFDDLTGLPIEHAATQLINYLNQWILCWYLIGFCSITKIAQVLGLSLEQVMEIAKLGTHISELSEDAKARLEYGFFSKNYKEKNRLESKKKQEVTLRDELYTRSESKSPLKPGPKSQK